jgi:hypothetical protein
MKSLIASSLICMCGCSLATSPALPEQVLCASSIAVVGRISSAKPTRRICAPPPENTMCTSPGEADVVIDVIEILGAGNTADQIPSDLVTFTRGRIALGSVRLLSSLSAEVAEAEAKKLTGTTFIFEIFGNSASRSIRAQALSLDSRAWVVNTLTGPECKKWQR